MKKKLNIIIGNAPVKNGNRGCVALSITSIYLLDELLSKYGYSCNFYLTDSGFLENGWRIYFLPKGKIKYYSCTFPLIYNVKQFVKFILKFSTYWESRRIFKEADYIFDIGQGDSFADIYGKERFYLIDRVHKYARILHKQYCLLPQTIGPFNDLSIEKKALKSIEYSTCVMARDRQSYDYIIKSLPQYKKIDEYIDVAFFMPFRRRTFESQYIHVGLNISSLLWNGGYTRDNQFGLSVDYQCLIRKLIESFLNIENVKLHLIPHVVLGEHDVENDYEVSCRLFYEYNHPHLILSEFFMGPIEAKNYISGMDFFMGARMHATIAAFSSGVPVVPMAYSRKFNGLFVDTLHYPYLADLKKMSEKEIFRLIMQSFKDRKELKSLINNEMSTTVLERKERMEETLIRFMNLK